MTQMCSASRSTRLAQSGFSPARAAESMAATTARRSGRIWKPQRGLSAHISSLSTRRIQKLFSPERPKVFCARQMEGEEMPGRLVEQGPTQKVFSEPEDPRWPGDIWRDSERAGTPIGLPFPYALPACHAALL